MNDTLTGALRECMDRLLEEQHSVTAPEIVECAYLRYPGVFVLESERLIRNAAVKAAKDMLRQHASDDDGPQGRLPGIALPSAIAVPEGDDFRYVRFDKADVNELKAGEVIRVRNVESAVAALDRYRASVDRLLPYFDAQHLTVKDAYEAWRAAQSGAA